MIVSKIRHVNMEGTDISFIICLILYLIFFLEIMFYLKLLKQWMRLSLSFISSYFNTKQLLTVNYKQLLILLQLLLPK